MKTCFLLSLFASAMLNSPAFAEKAPLSVEALQKQADVIVVANIEHIRVESEPSRFEPALGNSNWGISLTLRVETVEKGNLADNQLEARCFRIRHRRSITEYLTPSGHHPIPARGTRVRAYLEGDDRSWRVVLPNGIVPLDGNAEDAPEVTQLRGRAYTYILPMELWGLFIVVGVLVVLCGTLIVRRHRRRQISDPQVTEQSHSPEPAAGPVSNGRSSPPTRVIRIVQREDIPLKGTRRESLDRIADANQALTAGSGIGPCDYISLCRFHSRSVASELIRKLGENGVAARTTATRMYVNIQVAFQDRQAAFRILDEFRKSHEDVKPRTVSRDYDGVLLIAFATTVYIAFTAVMPGFTTLTTLAVVVTAISICIVVERLHRQYRLHSGQTFSLRDMMIAMTILAINLAVWRAVL